MSSLPHDVVAKGTACRPVPTTPRAQGVGPPREWVEGEVVVFDDSFEHEVWNKTAEPRLCLIVDMWHPDLDDEQRNAVLGEPLAARYRAIRDGADFEPAASSSSAAPSLRKGAARHCGGLHAHVYGAHGRALLQQLIDQARDPREGRDCSSYVARCDSPN